MNRRIWATLVIALALVASFAIGDSVGQRTMLSVASRQLNGVQAMLAFNHLLDGRQLKSLLAEDCIAQAASAIDIAVDKDTETLAELFKGPLDPAARSYVMAREPKLAAELPAFKSKYGQKWSVGKCSAMPAAQ
jgi:hypothetical protein